jgi:predicted secreted protein
MLLTLTDRDNGRRLPAHLGDLLEIHLAEIAPAGYRWAPDSYDTGLLELAEATASYPSAAVGSGGEAIFRFRIVGVGSSTLTLRYWRHWEGTGSIIQRFAVTIDATS